MSGGVSAGEQLRLRKLEERVPGNLGLRLPDPGSAQKSKPRRKKGTVQGGSGSVGWLLGGRRCRPGPGKQADPLVA